MATTTPTTILLPTILRRVHILVIDFFNTPVFSILLNSFFLSFFLLNLLLNSSDLLLDSSFSIVRIFRTFRPKKPKKPDFIRN